MGWPPSFALASKGGHPISLKGLQHTSVIELLAFMRLDQSFKEGQSALNLFRIFAPNSGMIAEWPAVASRDHEVHEVCLAAEHAESQSLPPKNSRTRCRRCKQNVPAHRIFQTFFATAAIFSRFKSRLSSSNRSTSSWLAVKLK